MIFGQRETYLSDSDHHVGNKRFESGDCTSLFISSIPHSDSGIEAGLLLYNHLHNFDFDWHVAQVFRNGTLWASDRDLSGLDLDFDICANRKELVATCGMTTYLMGSKHYLL